jgi:hypothetical protein
VDEEGDYDDAGLMFPYMKSPLDEQSEGDER